MNKQIKEVPASRLYNIWIEDTSRTSENDTSYYVPYDHSKTLLETVNELLANPEVIAIHVRAELETGAIPAVFVWEHSIDGIMDAPYGYERTLTQEQIDELSAYYCGYKVVEDK